MDHYPPEGYKVSSYCRTCGRDFTNDKIFDQHRTGSFEHDFSAEHPDGRRCKDDDELIQDGLRPMTEEEMADSRHRHRIGYNVEMWFDPVKAESDRKRFETLKG
jgi:hypothetical protein